MVEQQTLIQGQAEEKKQKHILLCWFGLGDARIPQDHKDGKKGIGPLAGTILNNPDPFDGVKIFWDANDLKLYEGDNKTNNPKITEYSAWLKKFLQEKKQSIEINSEPCKLPDWSDFNATHNAIKKATQNLPDQHRYSALLTTGPHSAPIAWILLASKIRARLLSTAFLGDSNTLTHQVTTLIAPVPDLATHSLFRTSPSQSKQVLFAWIAGKPDADSDHCENGPIPEVIKQFGSRYQKIVLLYDVKFSDEQAKIENILNVQKSDSGLIQIPDELHSHHKYKLETVNKSISAAKKHGTTPEIKLKLIDSNNDLPGVYYYALDMVTKAVKSTEENNKLQPVFIWNSGTKANTIAWFLIKVSSFNDAQFVDAWGREKPRVKDVHIIKAESLLEDLWLTTQGWFENDVSIVKHDYQESEYDAIREQFSTLGFPDNWLGKNQIENLFYSLKNFCGSRFESGNSKIDIGSVVILGWMACKQVNDTHNKFSEFDWSGKDKIRNYIIIDKQGFSDRPTIENTIKSLYDFFVRAFSDDKSLGMPIAQQVKLDENKLTITLKWDSAPKDDNESLKKHISGAIEGIYSNRIHDLIKHKDISEEYTHTRQPLLRFLLLSQIKEDGFGMLGSVYMKKKQLVFEGKK